MRFIVEHPYVFGVTLAVIGVYMLCYVLWFRAMGTDYAGRVEDE